MSSLSLPPLPSLSSFFTLLHFSPSSLLPSSPLVLPPPTTTLLRGVASCSSLCLLFGVSMLSARLMYITLKYWTSAMPYKSLWRHPLYFPAWESISTEKYELAWSAMKKPDGSFQSIANWGPNLDGSVYLMITDKDAIQHVLSSVDDSFPKSPVFYDLAREALGNGLVMSNGNVWKSQRRLITPFFHFSSLSQVFPVMLRLSNQFIDLIYQQNAAWVPAKETFVKHSAHVIIEFAFGNEFDVEWINHHFKELSVRFNYWLVGTLFFGVKLWSIVPYKYGRGLFQTRDKIRAKIYSAIRKRRESKEAKPDLLGYLCGAQYEDGSFIPEQLIIDECLTFLFAGQDTTGATLSWIFYYLSLHSDVVQKIRAEYENVVGDSELTMEHINELVYCNNVIKETLRIQPVVPWIDRMATEDFELSCGTKIYKGTSFGVGFYALHHHTKYWKNPYQFDPDRWNDPESKKSFIWTPFSAGNRNCIGMKFALMEIVILVSMMVKHFNVVHDTSKIVKPGWEGVLSPFDLYLKFTPINHTNN